MILIISNDRDFSTNDVIDWLIYQKKEWLRINETDPLQVRILIEFGNVKLVLIVNEKEIEFEQIESVWYRRGDLNFKIEVSNDLENNYFFKQIKYNMLNELGVLREFIHSQFARKRLLNNRLTAETNKLINLQLASELGINIPKTVITQDKNSLVDQFSGEKIITKAISESLNLTSDDLFVQAFTEEVKELNDFTFPSLFQNSLNKKFEVRSFLLNKKFYSMAIFSQKDKQTKTDFRRYNIQKPNRQVPYKLPLELEQKLILLADKININSGSFDLVVDKFDDHIFLEVNPVGQFGMVSYPCNYGLEKKIATYL